MHEEHEARLVHRIESFSDLVMGFSLALLSLSLVIPPHARELFAHTWWLVGYFWTFAYISSVWYGHQRLFAHIFVPNVASIVINFLMLSMLGLVVYFVQVFGRMHDSDDKAIAFLGYFTAFSVALICIGLLNAIGTKIRWPVLPLKERQYGVRRAVRGTLVGCAILGGVAYDYFFVPNFTMDSLAWLAIAAAIAAVLARAVVLPLLETRLMPAAAGEPAA